MYMSDLPITSVFNDGYIAELYEQYRRDPTSVDESWRQFFRFAQQLGGAEGAAPQAAAVGYDATVLRKAAAAASLIGGIRSYGHLAVQLDPLGTPPPGAAELKPEFYGITEQDLQHVPAAAVAEDATGTAADVVHRTRELYCGALAYEFEHLGDETERQWFRTMVESGAATTPLSADEK